MIAIYTNHQERSESLEKSKRIAESLTALYLELKKAGAAEIEIDDLIDLVKGDGYPTTIRELILRGKDLSVAGIQINPSTLQLPQDSINKASLIAKKTDPGKNFHDWNDFEIKSDKVVLAACCKTRLDKKHTVFGTEKTATVIAEAEKMCEILNGIFLTLDEHAHSPLRDPEALLKYDSETKTFRPNVQFLAGYVK